jgi:large subunit ribosomal protein L24
MKSGKPNKQRKERFQAPMSVRQKYAHAHISKELATKLGIKRRSIQLRKGDSVKIMAGDGKGKTGKIDEVDVRRGIAYVDSYLRKNAKGKEIQIPIRISNLYITDLGLQDKFRSKAVEDMKKGNEKG